MSLLKEFAESIPLSGYTHGPGVVQNAEWLEKYGLDFRWLRTGRLLTMSVWDPQIEEDLTIAVVEAGSECVGPALDEMITTAYRAILAEAEEGIVEEYGGRVKCEGCTEWVDPDWCWCGSHKESHNPVNGDHGFIPSGCECYRDKGSKKS